MSPNDLILIVLVVAAVVAVFLFFVWNKRRSEHLKKHFGPEYDRSLRQHGDRAHAEKELLEREKRVEKFQIRPLTPHDRKRFEDSWRNTQARFVDEPSRAVADAHSLLKQVMETRGYPMSNFEQRAADISVHYPRVVENYRAARNIVEKNERAQADTEDLRQAFVHFRALFVELLEPGEIRLEPETKRVGKEAVR